jgi:hypothetical protein
LEVSCVGITSTVSMQCIFPADVGTALSAWRSLDEHTLRRGAQVGDAAEVEAVKAGAAALKRLCRQRTLSAWKEWRASAEAAQGAVLQVGFVFSQPLLAFPPGRSGARPPRPPRAPCCRWGVFATCYSIFLFPSVSWTGRCSCPCNAEKRKKWLAPETSQVNCVERACRPAHFSGKGSSSPASCLL